MLKNLFCGTVFAALLSAAYAAAAAPPAPSDPAAMEAYRRLPYCRLAPDGKRLAEEPCRRPPTRGFAGRRAAPALPVHPAPLPRTPAREPVQEWRPTLAPPAMAANPVNPPDPSAAAVPPPAPPPAVQPLNQCGIAGCRGANGTPYQPGAGSIVLDPSGRMCTRHGDWVHCQ